VGVLGTKGTVQSGSYILEIEKFFPSISVSQEACPMWVPLVENKEYETAGADYFVQQHIDRILGRDTEIDTLLLGCTHYPLLREKIKQFVPATVQVIEQGAIVAQSLKNYLERHPEIEQQCSKASSRAFFTTGDCSDFDEQGAHFFGENVNSIHLQL
ncbi:MAG: aspartate/glutamate racemase family protein, partial [Gloeobacteraceae cyanobacterium ES-bin-316]|nr:aspartate/glutamate racemase family protein [Ferruginibacter sp.]